MGGTPRNPPVCRARSDFRRSRVKRKLRCGVILSCGLSADVDVPVITPALLFFSVIEISIEISYEIPQLRTSSGLFEIVND